MRQVKVSLEQSQVEFLDSHEEFGFKDKSSLVRAALSLMMEELEPERLRESANLYGELYSDNAELRELTEDATVDWPEQ
jgi:Arc/MetJ-type ribon-helix-helix transcriptional regulator